MFGEGFEAGVEFSVTDRVDHFLVVGPDFGEVIVIGEDVEADGFVGVPIGLQDAEDEGVFETAVYGEVQFAMFGVGDFDGVAAQFFPGADDKCFEGGVVFGGEQLDGFVPVGGFDVTAQVGEGDEVIFIEREGVLQALTDGGEEVIRLATDAGARLDFDETEGARHFQLFAQGGDRDAEFRAQDRQRGQRLLGLLVRGEVVEELGEWAVA